ncbi:MAG: pilus assembly protein PilZ [Methylobacterium radiotolerans]
MTAIDLPARYLDAAGVERGCVVRCASLDDIVVETEAVSAAGERVVCRIDGLGMLGGIVEDPAPGAFRLNPEAGAERRRRLAARIQWLRDAAGGGERRAAERVVPRSRGVVLGWSGMRTAGRLRDLSATGAAVELQPRPPLGAPVTIGARRAIVARHIEGGVAVHFTLPLHPADVHQDTIL